MVLGLKLFSPFLLFAEGLVGLRVSERGLKTNFVAAFNQFYVNKNYSLGELFSFLFVFLIEQSKLIKGIPFVAFIPNLGS